MDTFAGVHSSLQDESYLHAKVYQNPVFGFSRRIVLLSPIYDQCSHIADYHHIHHPIVSL